jgi:hypothetical protein
MSDLNGQRYANYLMVAALAEEYGKPQIILNFESSTLIFHRQKTTPTIFPKSFLQNSKNNIK